MQIATERLADLFAGTLGLPEQAASYLVDRALHRALHPRPVVQIEPLGLDLEGFLEAGLATSSPVEEIHPEIRLGWHRDHLVEDVRAGWFRLEWEGRTLEHWVAGWSGPCGRQERWWLSAATDEDLDAFLAALGRWSHTLRQEVWEFDGDMWSRNGALYRAIQGASLDQLVLPAALCTELRDDIRRFLTGQQTYARYGVPWRRGLLLVGPPGNGKTHTIKALVQEAGVACLYVRSLQPSHGTQDRTLHRVFSKARAVAPCLLVFEDLDALVTDANRSVFLNELDGFAANRGVLTIATTNHAHRLDPALVDRPGRFDRKYAFELPGPEERRSWWDRWNAQAAEELRIGASTLEHMVACTDGFSFAYLQELCLSASMRWMEDPRPMPSILEGCVQFLRKQMRSEGVSLPSGRSGTELALHATFPPDGGRMLPALEPYTLVLLFAGERSADPADDETLDQLQEAHVSYLLGLIDEGRIAVCGPVADGPDRSLRGVAVFRTSVDEALELMRRDPVVQAGRIAVQAMTWWAEKGRLPDITRGL